MRSLATVLLSLGVAGASLNAQNVTIDVKARNADKVFAELMRQTGKNFVYQSNLLKGRKFSVTADNEPLEKVLDQLFANTSITYKVRGNNVMLMPLTSEKEHPAAARFTVSGFVRESGSREAIIGAVVRDAASGALTITNSSGFYSLTIPAGNTHIEVTYTGFEPYKSGVIDLKSNLTFDVSLGLSHQLKEVVVIGARNNAMSVASADIGSYNLSSSVIQNTPVIFGESDVIKTLQLQPGVTANVGGMAGMNVHGGTEDENLYMLDNIPLYQVNHFGGLFSAFNTEAIRNVDFYKSSFPAKYDGRLSSYMDVHTKDGSLEEHHGSFKLGLTSGAFNIDGPIHKGTTSYSVALRRSWFDVITTPMMAIINSADEYEKNTFRYAFMDLNAKINHHFSKRSSAHVMFYYGDDFLSGKSSTKESVTEEYPWNDSDYAKLHWGNIVASAGWNYVYSPTLFGEITAAYSRYYSSMSHKMSSQTFENGEVVSSTVNDISSHNRISDVIVRGDFDWRPNVNHKVTFGAGFTRHSFLPSSSTLFLEVDGVGRETSDSTWTYRANEVNAYIGDDWTVNNRLRVNVGAHASLFAIDGKAYTGISPRLSMRYLLNDGLALKAGYSRAYQYVHQVSQSYISLPTDQWIPITSSFKPQSCDKISVAANWLIGDKYAVSLEGYYKWMHNIVEYRDEYYLMSPLTPWEARLTSGKGSAKGVDFKISREVGKLSGHIAYSLLWADRTFAEKNGGETFPARCDNRHKINVLLNWQVSKKWEINASWTGMTGNRMTLPTQVWQAPSFGEFWDEGVALVTKVNNYRLPFYHRLDLAFIRHTHNGFWTFSLYNAYCNMNTVAVVRGYSDTYLESITDYGYFYKNKPVFKQLRLLPIIPSISYTWKF